MIRERYKMLFPLEAVKTSVLVVLCLLLGILGEAAAQSSSFQSITQDFDLYRKSKLQEKLFLHLDRPVYACGETMWFKVYNVDGTLHKPLDMSKIAYVEVLDAAQKPVLQGKIALQSGTGNGSFVLPVTLASGNYTVRAYTSWMKNFASELFYEQPITILNTFQQLDAPQAVEAFAYTIQFFPEGGNLVAGVPNKVAFKATDQRNGKGIHFEGELHDQYGNIVAALKPHKFGLGHFIFTPVKGEKYIATVKLPNRHSFTAPLPAVHDKGYTLHLEEEGADRLRLTVNQVGLQAEQVYLLGHARQVIAMAEAATLNNGTASFLVDRSALADGVSHFTVFNAQKQPVCERLYFKQPTQNLPLEVVPDKLQYSTREKVSLDLAAAGLGSAKTANLSLAVYKLDALQENVGSTIKSYVWLTSDLKGTIENPEYYFSDAGKNDGQALDNLMLTHGWSRFKWEDILDKEPVKFQFVPEYNGHFISGKVSHSKTGAPAPGIVTYLASPSKHIRLYNSKSDINGLIRYELKDFYGQQEVVVQSDFTKDSTYRFEIFNPFSDKYTDRKLPALRLTEKLRQEITLRHVQTQVQHAYYNNYINRFRPVGVDSTAFYGKAAEQYLLDDYKRFKVMEEVMREYVAGVQVRKQKNSFHFKVINRPYSTVFQDSPLVLLDGVPVFDTDKIMAFDPLKIKRLDVVTSRFFSGPLIYNGIVSYTSYKGDLADFEIDPRALLQEYEGLQVEREFYAPSYDTEEQKLSRLADLRNLLYWAPAIELGEAGKRISFYTSDQVGTYLVVVQGITDDGVVGSRTLTLKVEQPLAKK